MSALDSTPSSNGVARKAWSEAWTHLEVDHPSPGYCRVTFGHFPDNAVSGTLVAELDELIGLIEADHDLNVVVFDGTRSGLDLSHEGGDPAWLDVLARLSRAPVVSIASIRGRARGAGAEFAVACDLRFAVRENTMLARLMADQVDAVALRLASFDHEAVAGAKSPLGGLPDA